MVPVLLQLHLGLVDEVRRHPASRRSARSSSTRPSRSPDRRGAVPIDGVDRPMTRYVLRRVAFSIVTLFLVITIVFLINNVFPSDVGRRLAGPFQSQEVVDQINEELGTNDPLIEQYGRMLKGVVHARLRRLVRPEQAGHRGDRVGVLALAQAGRLRARARRSRSASLAGIFAARRQGKLVRPHDRHARAGQLVDPGVRVERDPAGRDRLEAGVVPRHRQRARRARAFSPSSAI